MSCVHDGRMLSENNDILKPWQQHIDVLYELHMLGVVNDSILSPWKQMVLNPGNLYGKGKTR